MKTVLVLGAGVSSPYKFPLGLDLVQEIKTRLGKEDDSICASLLTNLKRARPDSIDSFLKDRPEFQPTAHSIIAEIILLHEDVRNLDSVEPGEDFYRLMANRISDEFLNQIGIITFNYDRILEYILSEAIAARMKLSNEAAFEKLKQMKIVHIHGRVTSLPGESQHRGFEYGFYKKERSKIVNVGLNRIGSALPRPGGTFLADEIATFGGIPLKTVYQNSDVNAEAQTLLAQAERVLFLGFGYHPLNMKILDSDDLLKTSGKRFAGTSLNLGGVETGKLRRKYPRLRLYDCTAVKFFKEHEDF